MNVKVMLGVLLFVPSMSAMADQENQKWTVLNVSPARVPDPRLKYRLLPGYGERKPGNAAVYYGKVNAEQHGSYGNADLYPALVELIGLTPKERLTSPLLNQMRKTQELLIEQPWAPNLYWAIAWLPRPWVDLRYQAEAEIDLMLTKMPGFGQLDARTDDEEFWAHEYLRAARAAGEMKHDSANQQSSSEVFLAAASWYPQARELLVQNGLNATDVYRMPVGKVLLLAEKIVFEQRSQQMATAVVVPWPKRDELARKTQPNAWPSVTGNLLWFMTGDFQRSHIGFQRWMNALQTVEALRQFAALNDGQLPESLDEITETPAPNDPFTEEPFHYRREGNTAWIDGPEIGDGQPFGYEIHLRRN